MSLRRPASDFTGEFQDMILNSLGDPGLYGDDGEMFAKAVYACLRGNVPALTEHKNTPVSELLGRGLISRVPGNVELTLEFSAKKNRVEIEQVMKLERVPAEDSCFVESDDWQERYMARLNEILVHCGGHKLKSKQFSFKATCAEPKVVKRRSRTGLDNHRPSPMATPPMQTSFQL
jgi:hypothetical protein